MRTLSTKPSWCIKLTGKYLGQSVPLNFFGAGIMDHAKIERLIAIISWGKTLVSYCNQEFVLRTPTPEEKARAAFVYENVFQHAINMGFMTENDTLSSLMEFGKWDQQKEDEIDGIQKDIHKIRKGLLDLVFHTDRLERARKLLRSAEQAIITRIIAKQELVKSSAESYALLRQQRFLISNITEKPDGTKYWKTQQDFDDDSDTELIHYLCAKYFETVISTSAIRIIARSGEWRNIWNAAKNTGQLFDNSNSAWSSSQKELAYWSHAYDSVFEAYERPSKDIIEDDDLLDSWFIRQADKIDARSKKSAVENQAAKTKKHGRQEQFIMTDKKGAKRVYDANDPMSRARILAKQRLIEKHGEVREQDMPDSQLEMKQQLMANRQKHAKSISSR